MCIKDKLAAEDGDKKNSSGVDDEHTAFTSQYDADDEDDMEVSIDDGLKKDDEEEVDEDEVEAQLLKLKEESDTSADTPSTASSALVRRSSSYGTFDSRPLSKEEMESNVHERWAQSDPKVDLSGSWTLIADSEFKKEYDLYLSDLGFNRIIRSVACSLISRTKELTRQSDSGRELYIKSTNPKGAWERTLTASGFPDFETKPNQTEYEHTKAKIKTAESEEVAVEAWWECQGTQHRSWLLGGKKGDYESLRYLDGDVLVCESIFHPCDVLKKKARVKWRFQRDA